MAEEKKTEEANTKKQTITLTEFRAWLSGVEEMQEEDWAPNLTQWKKIRSKIEAIENIPAAPPRQIATMPQHAPTHLPVMQEEEEFFVPPSSSALDDVQKRPEAPKQPINLSPTAPIARDPKVPAPAPNIDTSDGKYTSSFE